MEITDSLEQLVSLSEVNINSSGFNALGDRLIISSIYLQALDQYFKLNGVTNSTLKITDNNDSFDLHSYFRRSFYHSNYLYDMSIDPRENNFVEHHNFLARFTLGLDQTPLLITPQLDERIKIPQFRDLSIRKFIEKREEIMNLIDIENRIIIVQSGSSERKRFSDENIEYMMSQMPENNFLIVSDSNFRSGGIDPNTIGRFQAVYHDENNPLESIGNTNPRRIYVAPNDISTRLAWLSLDGKAYTTDSSGEWLCGAAKTFLREDHRLYDNELRILYTIESDVYWSNPDNNAVIVPSKIRDNIAGYIDEGEYSKHFPGIKPTGVAKEDIDKLLSSS